MRKTQISSWFATSIFIVLISLPGCKTTGQSSTARNDIEAVARQHLGEHVSISDNTSGTFSLCQQQRTGDHALRNFKYIVVRRSDNHIVHSGTYRDGYAQWNDDHSIEVLNSTMPGREPEKKIIQIDSK